MPAAEGTAARCGPAPPPLNGARGTPSCTAGNTLIPPPDRGARGAQAVGVVGARSVELACGNSKPPPRPAGDPGDRGEESLPAEALEAADPAEEVLGPDRGARVAERRALKCRTSRSATGSGSPCEMVAEAMKASVRVKSFPRMASFRVHSIGPSEPQDSPHASHGRGHAILPCLAAWQPLPLLRGLRSPPHDGTGQSQARRISDHAPVRGVQR
jgi:hypothetical protein